MIFAFVSCDKGKDTEADSIQFELPERFPAVLHPSDNAFSEERLALGKLLFYDPILSVDSSISCGSCHKQEFAFGDNNSVSKGVEGREGNRNSPSLANVAFHPYYTREGGVPTLEQHVLVPIQEHPEMDYNIVDVGYRIENHKSYKTLCEIAYPGKPYYFAIVNSIAQFQRSLLSANSSFDAFVFDENSKALNSMEVKGMNLFFSDKTQCASCHGGINFTNYAFENNGLYKVYNDVGRYRLTREKVDMEKFKIPSLRNVALTAPYMHDGSVNTLEDIVEHYNLGGKQNLNKSELVQPLGLTQEEKASLVAFLKALTDNTFINNIKYKKE